ncbi:MAG TPA: hypothetical protein PKY77_15565 [Phycisphaerae bacterium]|nr:hypothetical protein [Phycisphaerae bacterium]HRY66889.1 hypothetical protein [Phycisphaerae bacterium]HSA26948.1 hypothetical protein [Phycisphaerae bacterium]
MLSPRKKYIYGTIFGLACIGFVVDRIIGPGPEEAGARETAAGPAKAAAPAPAATAAGGTKSPSAQSEAMAAPEPTSPAAQRIRDLPEIAEARDLFRPTATEPALSETEQAREQNAELDEVAAFVAAHRLEGTFNDGRLRMAMVNGRTLRPGQVLDGFRLDKVEPYRAIFRNRDREAVLTMSQDSPRMQQKG